MARKARQRNPARSPGEPCRTSRLVYSTEDQVPRGDESLPDETPTRQRGIRLRLERRASGRVVTVVSGLPGASQELADLARALKAACGAGGTTKDGVLELQGDHRDKVEAALAARGLSSKRAGG
jgi:translation initiation factor 1